MGHFSEANVEMDGPRDRRSNSRLGGALEICHSEKLANQNAQTTHRSIPYLT